MPTACTYIPIIGDYSAPFAVVTGDGTTVPRDVTAAVQGVPRPGALKHVLSIASPNPTADSDAEVIVTIPIPPSRKITAAILAATVNSAYPAVNVSRLSGLGVEGGAQVTAISVANQTMDVTLDLSADAVNCTWQLTIDFAHSSVN